jgi:hypothetical protein
VSLVRLLMRVVGEVGAPPQKNPCLGFALGPSLNPVVRSHGLHGTTPPYIYGPSRAKTKWNGSWTGWFIIFRPNSHENIGHFEPDPKNGMLPSPARGAHPLPKASSALVLHRVKAQKSMPFAQDQHEVHGSCSRNCCGGALEAPSPLSPFPPQTHGAKGTTPDLFFWSPKVRNNLRIVWFKPWFSMEPPPLTYTVQVGPKPNGTGFGQGGLLYFVQTLTKT